MNIVYEAMETIKMFDRARDARRVAKSIRTHQKTMSAFGPLLQEHRYPGVRIVEKSDEIIDNSHMPQSPVGKGNK